MKKIILIAIISLISLAGCKKDNTLKQEGATKPITISITINGNISETVLVR